jgi:uncharacterized membrane protein YfcA
MEAIYIAVLGVIMGIVTSIAGGAGVFAVPTLIALGVPPISALTLNRTSDLGVLTGAIGNYARTKEFDARLAAVAAVPLSLGAFLGANFSASLSSGRLKGLVIFAVLVGIYVLIAQPKEGLRVDKSRSFWGLVSLVGVGFWSGAVGMAGATFGVLVLVSLFGKSFLGARSVQVVAAVPETIVSVIVLGNNSSADWRLSATIYVSSLVGAFLGSQFAVKSGGKVIRIGMIVISAIMILKVTIDIIGTG